jgi:small-conductance mechanosensitive channel
VNNLEQLSIEDLQAQLNEINVLRDKLAGQAREISAILARKQAEAAAQHKLASMTEVERAALAQIIQAGAIGTGEEFGEL